MKTLHRISLLLAFFLAPIISDAQNGYVLANCQSNVERNPSSASARQVEYQLPQPSLVTGAVNFNIPLYTIDVEGFSLPFSLSYQSSGIKPLDDPFPCGYGWTIQPSLKITRIIRSRPDEYFEMFKDSTGEISQNPRKGYECMRPFIEGGKYDLENDIFKIALPSGVYTRLALKGSDGRFNFVGGHDDNQIVIATDNYMKTITVTDEKGIIYRFGGPYEATGYILDENILTSADNRTSWTLKEIELPSGRKITFSWEKKSYDALYISGGDIVLDSYNFDIYHPTNFNVETTSLGRKFKLNGEDYRERLHLASVCFPGGTMDFSYDRLHLTGIKISSSGNELMNVQLDYGEGKSKENFLKEVSITGKGSYKFEYNDCNFDDPDARLCQDWWGYYNGRKPIDNKYTLTPLLKFKCYEHDRASASFREIGRADRRPDEKAMQAGILTMATYPTGATTKFEYETHRFKPQRVASYGNLDTITDPYLNMGGGLRLKRMVTHINSKDSLERWYKYDSVAVVAVPSAATFVSEMYTVSLPPDVSIFSDPFILRLLSFGYQSDYMNNHPGLDPIWYPRVTEYFKEGKIEYYHQRTLPDDQEFRGWGLCYPGDINNALGKGPRLVCKKTYKQNGDHYNIVETQHYKYEQTEAPTDNRLGISKGSIENIRGTRILIQNAYRNLDDLDFEDGKIYKYYLNGTYWRLPLEQIVDTNLEWKYRFWSGTPYRFYGYRIALRSDRLKSKTVTRHLENGDFTQTETYEYRPGTSIVTSVVTTTSGDTRTDRVDITYASATGSTAEKGMVAANMTGVPVRTKQTFGSATSTVSHDMANYGNRVYRPSKTYQQRGSAEKWLVGEYRYDSYGNLTESRGEDSIPTSYLWGYGSLHPVYKIEGAGYPQVSALNPGADALGGSAELTDLTARLKMWLTTRTLWKPLVGVSSQREPCGLTSTYKYDTAGRLIETAVDGNGPVSGYAYHINENGHNYRTRGIYTSATAKGAQIREIINYDGLGRETTRLSVPRVKAPTARDAVRFDTVFSLLKYYATLTEYDAMGRPYRQWAPVTCGDTHPAAQEIASVAEDFYGTPHAYVTTLYEASPSGTVTGTINSGSEWHDNNRRRTVRHLTNTETGDYSCHRLTLSGTSLARTLYGKGSLLIEETTDEEGHVAMTFTDCKGRTVMTREGSPGDWNDTRYIYNDHGDLLAVLQPMSSQTGTTLQKEWAFTYRYDERGRCVEKAIPGTMAARYVYDKGGRLFAEQDGMMQSCGEWLLHFYDRFGREAFSAVSASTASEVTAASKKIYTATPPASGSGIADARGGYTVGGGLSLTLTALDRAVYYDNYDFGGGCNWISPTANSSLGVTARADVTGLPTGSYSEGRASAFYYDGMGRTCLTLEGPYAQQWPDYGGAELYDYEGRKITELRYSFAPDRATMQKTAYSYDFNGQLEGLTVTQGRDTATVAYAYDDAGRVSAITCGKDIRRALEYDVHGWLRSIDVTVPQRNVFVPLSLTPQLRRLTVHHEDIRYADTPSGVSGRYDGRIAARTANGDLTSYGYDIHGRLTSAKSVTMKDIAGEAGRDYSAAYNYDKNANITSLYRKGITDVIGGQTRLFGAHSVLYMYYSGNQIRSLTAEGQGSDYEGRTGLGTQTPGRLLAYDANGNLRIDEPRNIVRMTYDRRNLPVEITFGDGHRQAITYDGSGRKVSTVYSQVPEAMLRGGMTIYSDGLYEVTSTREYVGPYVFTDGRLEYSSFPGGYFDPSGGAMYYVTDWQGNNVAVVDKDGKVMQRTVYYPDGEPTIEPAGQRYLFGGKEREHAGGRNSYDFGARCLTPYGRWGVVDPMAEKFYPISPYSYCGGDPINRIDSNGMEWTVTESKDGTLVKFHITGVVINTSSKDFDLNKVAKAIENQLKDVYTFSNDDVSVTMSAEIRAVTSADDIKDTDHVFRIQDQSSFRKGELANAMTPGLNIRLGTKLVEETLSGENTRTIAHEVGHSGGLSHTNLTERTLPIYDMNTNLMTKIEDLNRGADKNKATMLQTNQINEIVKMYRRGKLNHGSPLRKRYNPQRLSTWPYITLTSKYLCR